MIAVEIQYELERLSVASQQYGVASGKTEAQVVSKQSAKLAWNIFQGLKALAPAKGFVKAERLASLRAGHGVHVRQAVFDDVASKYGALPIAEGRALFRRRGKLVGSINRGGKHLNLMALAIERELGLREKGRGFSSYATPRPAKKPSEDAPIETLDVRNIFSRYNFTLGTFKLDTRQDVETKYAQLRWVGSKDSSYSSALEGLSTSKQQAVVADAVKDTTQDTMEYIKKKQLEDIQRFFGA